MERTPNKSQHTKLTLEKKILPPLLPGFELATFRSRVGRSYQQAIPTTRHGQRSSVSDGTDQLAPCGTLSMRPVRSQTLTKQTRERTKRRKSATGMIMKSPAAARTSSLSQPLASTCDTGSVRPSVTPVTARSSRILIDTCD